MVQETGDWVFFYVFFLNYTFFLKDEILIPKPLHEKHYGSNNGSQEKSTSTFDGFLSRKENPQKLTQLSSRSYPRHLVGNRTAQKDTIIDITSDSQVNSNFPYRWSPASLTFDNYFTCFIFYLYIT